MALSLGAVIGEGPHWRLGIENHLQLLLKQYLNNNNKLILRSLRKADMKDINNNTIAAEILNSVSKDLPIKLIACRLTIQRSATGVSWKIIGQENDL